jgi:hypothetical protein
MNNLKQADKPAPYFTRETLEKYPTEILLILLPEFYQIFKDSGTWTIGHMDTDEKNFRHPTCCDYNIREYLIEFLLQHPFTGDEIEITRWVLATTRKPSAWGESL